jgi:hypothetical protein
LLSEEGKHSFVLARGQEDYANKNVGGEEESERERKDQEANPRGESKRDKTHGGEYRLGSMKNGKEEQEKRRADATDKKDKSVAMRIVSE